MINDKKKILSSSSRQYIFILVGSYYSWPIKEEIINLDFLILLSIKKDNHCCQSLLIALVHGKEMIKCKYKL